MSTDHAPASPAPPEAKPLRHKILAFALLALALAAVACFGGADPDFFWHVRTGALYLLGARPDLADPYSWTAAGRYWLDHEWLAEVIWAKVTALGGLGAVHALQVGLLALLVGLVYRVARGEGAGPLAAATGALGVLSLAFPWWLPRLQVVSGLGLAALLHLVQRFYAGRAGPLLPVAVGLVMLAWANLHGGGAMAGAVSLTIVLAVEALARRKTPGLPWLAAACGAAWVALLLTPAGVRLPVFALAVLLDPRLGTMNAMIYEWHAFNPAGRLDQLYAVWMVGLVAAGLLARRLPRPAWLALGVAWLLMGIEANRNMPLAAIATTPLLAGFLATWPDWPPVRRRVGAAGLALATALFVVCHPVFTPGRASFTDLGFTTASPASLAALGSKARGRKLLNWYSWGGQIIDAALPGVRVFIDGRQYVYGLDVNRDYFVMAGAHPGYEALLAHYGIDAAFFPRGWPLATILAGRPGWHVAYHDASAVLLLRGKP